MQHGMQALIKIVLLHSVIPCADHGILTASFGTTTLTGLGGMTNAFCSSAFTVSEG